MIKHLATVGRKNSLSINRISRRSGSDKHFFSNQLWGEEKDLSKKKVKRIHEQHVGHNKQLMQLKLSKLFKKDGHF